MNQEIFNKKNRETRQQESHILDSDGNIAVRTIATAAAPDPETGITPAMPTTIWDDEGNQITSFGSPSTIAEYKSPNDFTASYLSNNTITLSAINGFVISDSSQLVYIRIIHADNTSEVLTNGSGGITLGYSAGTLTVTGATPFVTGDVYEVGVNGQKKGYDASSGLNLDFVSNPEWKHYTEVEHSDISDTAAGTYQEVMFMDGYRSAAIQVLGSGGVTFKIYMTLADEASDDDFSGDLWEDATLDVFGAASIVDSGALGFIETIRMPKKIGIEYVTSAATNAIDIYKRKY